MEHCRQGKLAHHTCETQLLQYHRSAEVQTTHCSLLAFSKLAFIIQSDCGISSFQLNDKAENICKSFKSNLSVAVTQLVMKRKHTESISS